MNRKTLIASSALVALLVATGVGGQEQQDTQDAQANQSAADSLFGGLNVKLKMIRTLAFHPKLIAAVKKQNAEGLTLQTIQQRDKTWREEGDRGSLKRALQVGEASRVLRILVDGNSNLTEAFLTDDQGANVAVFPATSDYWQGDEEKWTASFNEGQGQTFVGPVEFDESTGSTQVQVSAPVFDVDTKETLGVLVVGVTFEGMQANR